MVINIEKQIDYWRTGAESNIDTASLLIDHGKYIEGLFFCHLAIEKILKALYVKHNKLLAPKIHKLQYLAEETDIALTDEQKDFFGVLMQFQLEGRYPEFYPPEPSEKDASEILSETKNTLIWLTQKL